MGWIEVLGTALALSVDAFVCSVISGKKRLEPAQRLVTGCTIAVAFGLFQFLMPVIGFAAGITLQKHFSAFDHWVAFGLLAIVALNMLKEAFFDHDDDSAKEQASELLHPDPNAPCCQSCLTAQTAAAERCAHCGKLSSYYAQTKVCAQPKLQIGFFTLLALAVGTSIDALAVGVSYGLIQDTILRAATIIGVVCALCSLIGFYLGQVLALFTRLDPILNTVGALVLLGIGVRILSEHQALNFL